MTIALVSPSNHEQCILPVAFVFGEYLRAGKNWKEVSRSGVDCWALQALKHALAERASAGNEDKAFVAGIQVLLKGA